MTKSFFSLTDLLILKVWGQDSERYLNNRFSNNVKNLTKLPDCQYTAALSAQGKTEALAMLFKIAKDQFMLITGGLDHDSIIRSIFKYKVADKFNYEKVNADCSAVHLFDSDLFRDPQHTIATLEQLKQMLQSKILSYSCFRTEQLGLDLIASCPLSTLTQALETLGYKQVSQEKAELLRFRAKIPAFSSEINDKFLLQESDPKGSYSTSKGCYVGQEVTQKIDSFAKLPFKLVFLKAELIAESETVESTVLFSDSNRGNKVGEIISFINDKVHNSLLAFARIKNQLYPEQKLYSAGLCFELSEIFDFSLGNRECFYLE